MAEVRKKENIKKEKVDKKKAKTKVVTKKETTKVNSKKKTVAATEKKSLWVKFRIFCHGVKSETLKVHWPSKKDMMKYSIATISFVVFCSLFFYLINVIFALIQSLF